MNRRHKSHSVVSQGEPEPKKENSGSTGLIARPTGVSGRRHRSKLSHGIEYHRAPALSEQECFADCPCDVFCCLVDEGRHLQILIRHKGFLDLYSGCSAVARNLAKRFGVWVVTIDFEHGSDQDLLDPALQQLVLEAIHADCFLGLGAAPERSSFSRAVHPAVRGALEPRGLTNLSKTMQSKVEKGNRHADFLLEVLLACVSMGMAY